MPDVTAMRPTHTTRPGPTPPAPGGGAVTRSQTRGAARWIRPSETVEVEGFTIRGGLLYVGASLPSARGHETDHALVNTSKKVAASGADVAGTTMGYWPSYSEIAPAARLAYLEWLASGRRDARYGVGYAFLFVYGLERRLLVDGVHDDAAAIAAELRRLAALYGDKASFRRHCAPLVDVADHFAGRVPSSAPTAADARAQSELPLGLRVRLGRKAARGEPLDADDALLWTMQSQGTPIRTPVSRCFPEALALWKAKFAAAHPQGLRVPAPRTALRFRYQSASGTFEREVAPTLDGRPLPDVAAVQAPLKGLRDMLDACSEELGAYSRLLGKDPSARGTREAALLLPRMALDTEAGAPARDLHARVMSLLGGRNVATVSVPDLLGALGMRPPEGARLTAAFCGAVGEALDRLDVAFEPDRRHGPAPLVPDGIAVLFKAGGGAPVDGSGVAYRAARTVVEVAALAATAGGKATQADFDAIKSDVGQAEGLRPVEKARLLALATLSLKDSSRQGAILARLGKLPEAERARVARSAVAAVLADGHATPAGVRFLERLHKSLGLPVGDVYGQLHRGGVDVDEPSVVAAEEPSRGTALPPDPAVAPPPPAPAASRVRIDAARLARIKAETADVSDLLADIFREDDPPAPPAAETPASSGGGPSFGGLDGPHGALLAAVLAAGPTPRAAFDAKARELGLMPAGALETINEWAFDRLDEAALDGDDVVLVPEHLRAGLGATVEDA